MLSSFSIQQAEKLNLSLDENLVDRDNKDGGKDVGNDGIKSDGGGEGSAKVVGKLEQNDWFLAVWGVFMSDGWTDMIVELLSRLKMFTN